jgi:tight adherence protein C
MFTTIVGATGVWLLVSGLPWPGRNRLAARVDPYLSGLRGRPSRLLSRPHEARGNAVRRWIARVDALSPERAANVTARLDAAGFEGGVEAFRVQQATWGVTAGMGGTFLLVALAGAGMPIEVRTLPALAVAGFATGWLARDWWLTREVDARRAVVAGDLPVAIDLITLAILAGESVPAACARAASAIGAGIGGELDRTVAEIRSGAPVIEALEAMSRRVPDPAVARFVDALCTGIEKGAPLADVLRAQADDAREARRRRLFELGGRREVLMLVPVVFLIMPVVVLFALFPGLVSLDLLVP